jgi:hypothetical protein
MTHLRRTPWLVLVATMLAPWGAQAQNTSGAGFYPFRGTARTIGMAGAYFAVADDTAGLQWNPAGMAQLNTRQGEATIKVNGSGEQYLHFAFISPVKPGQFGCGVQLFRAADGAGRSDRIAEFTYGQYATSEIAFGGTVKYQDAKTSSNSSDNFSFDIGVLYRPKQYKQWTAALTVLDINEPSFTGMGLQKRTYNFGLGYRPDSKTVLDLDWYDVGSIAKRGQARFGAERQVTNNFALRAGVAENTFGVGLSLMFKYVTVDYGFQHVSDASDLNMLSLTGNF